MKQPWILVLIIWSGALSGAPQREQLAIQEMRLSLEEVGYQIHSHKVEIDLFQERIGQLEKSVEKLSQQLKHNSQDRSVEGRLTRLEKAHESLIGDFKCLKGHLNEVNSALTACQNKLSQIDTQLSSDIKGLKHSLESMLALLQKSDTIPDAQEQILQGQIFQGQTYIVKSGDSLGKIALDHKTDISTLKRLNHLSTDTIYPGQKLNMPK